MSEDTTRHRTLPWRVHTLAPDFRLLDVWRVPIEAEPARGETFDEFFELFWENGIRADSAPTRVLYWLRFRIGSALGWDKAQLIPGSRERSLAERLNEDDRRRDRGSGDRTARTPAGESVHLVYRFEDEALVEVSNTTVAALFHIGWVDIGSGKRTVETAVYIKTRGFLSRAYMAAIMPFRHVFVYPSWTGHVARLWRERQPA